ncbi:MAG: hypothetical protein JWM85_3499 [Acidimicrobiaceae bacterium]|nr:hypothetical protein [Acidimicrobiaceae bacterium]
MGHCPQSKQPGCTSSWLRGAVVATATAAAIGSAAGPAAASSHARVSPPAVSGRALSIVPAAGGPVKIRVHVAGGWWCQFSALDPYVGSINKRVWCGNETFTATGSLQSNPALSTRHFTIGLTVEGRSGQVVHRRIAVTQARAPKSVDRYSGVPQFGLYGNGGDQAVGDCAVAAVGDVIQSWDAQEGLPAGPLGPGPFLTAYQSIVGGPGGPNIGADSVQVLNYWQRTGIAGNKITAWHSIVNPGIDRLQYNPVKTGVSAPDRATLEDYLASHGALYGGVFVPVADYTAAMDTSSTPWTTVEAPRGRTTIGAHGVAIVGYDSFGPDLATWGYVQHVTWAWWAAYGQDAFWMARPRTFVPNLAPPAVSTTTTTPPVATNSSSATSATSTPTAAAVGISLSDDATSTKVEDRAGDLSSVISMTLSATDSAGATMDVPAGTVSVLLAPVTGNPDWKSKCSAGFSSGDVFQCELSFPGPGNYSVSASFSGNGIQAIASQSFQIGPTSETLTEPVQASYSGTSDLVCGAFYCSTFSTSMELSNAPAPSAGSTLPGTVTLSYYVGGLWTQFATGSFPYSDSTAPALTVTGGVSKESQQVEVNYAGGTYTSANGELVTIQPASFIVDLPPPLW